MEQSTKENNPVKDRSGAYLAGIIIIFVVGGFFVIKPQIQNYKNLNISLSAKKEEAQGLTNAASSAELLRKNYAAAANQVLLLDQALPKFNGGEDLLIQMENIAGESGVVLSSVDIKLSDTNKSSAPAGSLGLEQVQQPVPGAEDYSMAGAPADDITAGSQLQTQTTLPYQTISLSLAIQGSFDNLKVFLNNLEKSLRVIDVMNISSSNGSSSMSSQESEGYNLEARTYALE